MLGGMLLISALTVFAVPALAGGDKANGGVGNGPWSEDGGETPSNSGQNVNEDMYQRGVNKSLMGKMSYSYGYGHGGFVFYTIEEDTGNVTDYGLITPEGDKVLLDRITVEGFVLDEVDTHGSIAKIVGENTTAVVHDNPTGMYHLFVDRATNVTIVLSGDMVVTENRVLNESSNLTYQLIIFDGLSKGVIASDDPLEVTENGTVIKCNVTEHMMVRFLPQVQHRHQWMEMVLMEAVRNGQVAAEITLVGNDDGGIYDVVSYRHEMQVQVEQVIKNKFQIRTQGQNAPGALLLVHTEEGTMDMSQERLRVRLDDVDMRQTDDPLELIYGQPDDACYSVIDDGEVQQLLVYLPADTLGTLTVEDADPLSVLMSPVGLAVIIGAIGLVALAGILAFKKK